MGIPIVGPSIRDPRIQLSMTILSIIIIGTGWLGFRLSGPQILLTIAACGLVEASVVLFRERRLVWPASAFQTATSTALLFQVIGTEARGSWTLHGWYLFVGVGLFGLATKYLLRVRGGHIFNPSNIALVAGFLLFGSQRVEPLDFWWAPIGPAMIAAYVVIFTGGLFICGRLRLLGMGLAFWLTLAAGMGILAGLGHTITTRWSFAPVGGTHFWWIILTSPEIFIFLFFMITDPKTVPAGRVARVVFGVAVGVASSLLMAPWDTEFGVKVGLLAGLVVVCAVRPFVEGLLPAPGSADDHLGRWIRSLLSGREPSAGRRRLAVGKIAAATAVTLAFGGGVAAAGLPNGGPGVSDARVVDLPSDLRAGLPAAIDPASLPTVTIDRDIAALSASLATPASAQQLAATLVWNLRVETEAIVTGDASLLPAIIDGQRLHDVTAQIEAASPGERTVPEYTFATLHLETVYPGGFQRGANAGLISTGTVVEATYDDDGTLLGRSPARPFAVTFSLRQTTNGRWLTTDTLPAD